MSYVRSKAIAKRFKQDRRVSGADILRKELSLDEDMDVNLLQENSELQRRGDQPRENVTAKISRTQMSSEDFEEWIKLATDNKINSTNSWNFALIDYFHEMSLLKEGDNINFQKASATLDGCVKIYSSRVDSIATETGRLLTGLATKKDDQTQEGDQDDEDGDSNEEGEDGESSKKKKKLNRARMVDTTLVDFNMIKMKKLDSELEIDPLFKRALSEFDEGGAKSLLLNILNINEESRIVFDAGTSSETIEEVEEVEENADDIEEEELGKEEAEKEVKSKEQPTDNSDSQASSHDILDLKRFIFSDIDNINSLELCPSMNNLQLVLQDINQAKTILNDVNNGDHVYPLGHENTQSGEGGELMNDDIDFGRQEYDMDDGIPDYGDEMGDMPDNENDEDGKQNLVDILETNEEEDEKDADGNDIFMDKVIDTDLMAYFDQNMKTNWAGPEHWKVSALKKRSQKIVETPEMVKEKENLKAAKKKKKEEFRIDFLNIGDDTQAKEFETKIFKTGGKIDIPKTQQTNEAHYLLPRDVFFSSQRLLKLFTKPDHVRILKKGKKDENGESADINRSNQLDGEAKDLAINEAADENYWASKYEEVDNAREPPDDNQDFYNDYNDYGNDAEYELNDEKVDNEPKFNGTQLIAGARKARPEYMNFSRTAKRVDVKFLKDNLWKSLEEKKKVNDIIQENPDKSKENHELDEVVDKNEKETIKFSDVVNGIGKMYNPEERKDLSTSFCFICMLHLANEHGLNISNEKDGKYQDLTIV